MPDVIELREWQKQALALWLPSWRGIVAAVTGAGKTTLALRCIEEFIRFHENGQVLIIVPTLALLDQWYLALSDDLKIPQSEVGLISGNGRKWEGKAYLVAVINSARRVASELAAQRPTMLVVDECHRAGSERNAEVLLGSFAATLGLSATPERQYDDGFERHVRPALGEVIFQYGYEQAFADGVISPFRLVNIEFDLSPQEQAEYDALTRRIARLMRSTNRDDLSEHVQALLRRRARISWNSPLRVPLAAKVALQYPGDRTIVFHESVDQATLICNLLLERGVRATLYHTGLSPERRRENLRLYKNGYYSCLVCCRALDEGLNVPRTSVGIVASSTSSIRQRIQRLGRVLRQVPGKEAAVVYTLYATQVEARRLAEEMRRLSGITQVKWLRAEVGNHG